MNVFVQNYSQIIIQNTARLSGACSAVLHRYTNKGGWQHWLFQDTSFLQANDQFKDLNEQIFQFGKRGKLGKRCRIMFFALVIQNIHTSHASNQKIVHDKIKVNAGIIPFKELRWGIGVSIESGMKKSSRATNIAATSRRA